MSVREKVVIGEVVEGGDFRLLDFVGFENYCGEFGFYFEVLVNL